MSKPSPARTFKEFLKRVDDARADLKFEGNEEVFYRGHADSSWSLLPTLLRHAASAGLDDLGLRELESDLFFEFQARARELHDRFVDDYDVLFVMRHHGVATRVLDWTEVLGVALYFALRDRTAASSPCVWILNPWALNEKKKSWEVRELIAPKYLAYRWEYSDFMNDTRDLSFDWTYPVALYPLQRNARLHAQRGYFTIHGDDRRPLEKIVPSVVRQVRLAPEAIPEALEVLKVSGIDDYLLFPDYDGLRRTLHSKNGVEQPWLDTGGKPVRHGLSSV